MIIRDGTHKGVENPAVLTRMENMKAMAEQMEVLFPMVRGKADFETSWVTTALEALQVQAGKLLGIRVRSLWTLPPRCPDAALSPSLE